MWDGESNLFIEGLSEGAVMEVMFAINGEAEASSTRELEMGMVGRLLQGFEDAEDGEKKDSAME